MIFFYYVIEIHVDFLNGAGGVGTDLQAEDGLHGAVGIDGKGYVVALNRGGQVIAVGSPVSRRMVTAVAGGPCGDDNDRGNQP